MGTTIDIDEDRWPRLLLSISEERCGLCRCPKVTANATPGMRRLATDPVEGEFCLNPSCLAALRAKGPLGALKGALYAVREGGMP